MKPSRVLPFTILFATATVFGQSLVLHRDGPSLASSPVGTIGGECPVRLQVDHGSSFERREVGDRSKPGLEQRIHLTMTNPHPKKIVSAQFTVHGLSQKARMMDLSTPEADMVKTVRLALEIDGNGQGSSDVSLSRFAVVTAVDLNAVTYADGSTWRELSAAGCSVKPSLLMRVSAER
jgi:hypothetical protein